MRVGKNRQTKSSKRNQNNVDDKVLVQSSERNLSFDLSAKYTDMHDENEWINEEADRSRSNNRLNQDTLIQFVNDENDNDYSTNEDVQWGNCEPDFPMII